MRKEAAGEEDEDGSGATHWTAKVSLPSFSRINYECDPSPCESQQERNMREREREEGWESESER